MGYTLSNCICCATGTECDVCSTGYYLCIESDCSGLNDAQITLLPHSPGERIWSNQTDPFFIDCEGTTVSGIFTLNGTGGNCNFSLSLALHDQNGADTCIFTSQVVDPSGGGDGVAITGDYDSTIISATGDLCACFARMGCTNLHMELQCDPCDLCPTGVDNPDYNDPCCPCCLYDSLAEEMTLDFGVGGLTNAGCIVGCDVMVGEIVISNIHVTDGIDTFKSCQWEYGLGDNLVCTACLVRLCDTCGPFGGPIDVVSSYVSRILLEIINDGEDCFWKVSANIAGCPSGNNRGCNDPDLEIFGCAVFESDRHNSFGYDCSKLPVTLTKVYEHWDDDVCIGTLPNTIQLQQ